MTLEPNVGEAQTIRAISHRSTNDAVYRMVLPLVRPGARVLDLGAGEGYFSKMVGDHIEAAYGLDPGDILDACDVAPEIFRYDRITCQGFDAGGVLPYQDGSFDAVCSLEVVEHVEDQFAFCREIMRVLKPAGLAVLSTPNVLNINSRVRILHSGFATLFDPLPLSEVDAVHTSGHIHPVSYYYLAFALLRAGASSVSVQFDRYKRSAFALRMLLWPLLKIGNASLKLRLRRKKPALMSENAALLRDLWSSNMLTSRSIIVRAEKSAS